MCSALRFAAALLVAPAAAGAQDVAGRIAAEPASASVRFTFDAREGLCGDGENILLLRDARTDRVSTLRSRGSDRVSILRSRGSRGSHGTRIRELREVCDEGPVRVTLEREDALVQDLDVEVGGVPDAAVDLDLGHIPPDAAVAYLLDTLAPQSRDRVAREAIFAATLAGGVEPWPALLRLARDRSLDRDVRRNAIFWLGQAAADRAADGLIDIASADDEDLELRKHALFVLAQRRDERSTTALLDIAREHENRQLRRAAIFWLGQTDDARALALFEEILLGR